MNGKRIVTISVHVSDETLVHTYFDGDGEAHENSRVSGLAVRKMM